MRNIARTALIVFLASCGPAYGQTPATDPYPKMAPVSQYLMPRAAEIAMARSAGPASISAHAEVLALTKSGYVVAAKGTNGWTCLVGRMWTAGFDDPEFWNPKGRGPACFNPPAAKSVRRNRRDCRSLSHNKLRRVCSKWVRTICSVVLPGEQRCAKCGFYLKCLQHPP